MALTYTPPVELNTKLPQFSGLSTSGKNITQNDFSQKKALVVMFICNHCPYVLAIEDRLISLAQRYQKMGVEFIAISSNDPKDYPEDSYENLKLRADEKKYPFAYIFDEAQSIAKSFSAVCTPDLFLYKNETSELALFYRGRLDDSWKSPDKVSKEDLSAAIDLALNNRPPPKEQIPSMGCSIKWSH